MSITKKVSGIIESQQKIFKSSPNYNEMRIFLQQAQKDGIVLKKEYSIPAIDTIGKRYSNYANKEQK